MLEIISNGSKWAGEEPDTLETLLELLEREPLDPRFEQYGNFVDCTPDWLKPYADTLPPNTACISGNFWRVSHVFNIHTDSILIIEKLERAIRTNQERDDYKAAKVQLAKWEASE